MVLTVFSIIVNVHLKCQNVNLLMMGTADALPVEPVTKTTFVEDLTENQLAKAVSSCFCLFNFFEFHFFVHVGPHSPVAIFVLF